MKVINKKIALSFGTIAIIATPVVIAVSCSKETTTEENAKETATQNIQSLVIQDYLHSILENDHKTDFDKLQEDAWNFWASQKLRTSSEFWMKTISNKISSGALTSSQVIDENGKKLWVNAENNIVDTIGNGPKAIEDIKRNYYPSWNIAKQVILDNPNLLWETEINKLILASDYLTRQTGTSLKKLYKGKKESDNITNIFTKDTWAKIISEDKDEKTKKANIKAIDKVTDIQYVFLTKYLKENTPTFVWKQEITESMRVGFYAIHGKEISNPEVFNKLNGDTKLDILKNHTIKSNYLQTSNSDTLDVEKLYNFKGISPTGFSKADLNYSSNGLKKHMHDNMSKVGWVNKEEYIKVTDPNKPAEVIIKDKKGIAEYVMQFLPWFDAKDKDGKSLSEKGKTSIDDYKYKLGDVDNDKSIFRPESNLLKDKSNLQQFLFTLAMKDSAIYADAKRWLVVGRDLPITTGIDDLLSKLKDEGLAK